MDSLDLLPIMRNLAEQRHIFHSEADFQHALAWKIHECLPECMMRLEYKSQNLKNRIYLDIWIRYAEQQMAIELKYKTRGLQVTMGDEGFNLADQSAQDLGRYDFVKDIQRLEQIVANIPNTTGYAILLTNDSSYWYETRSTTGYYQFRLEENRRLGGTLQWGASTGAGTMKNRELPINLYGKYSLHWERYTRVAQSTYGEFRYLLVKVESEQTFHHSADHVLQGGKNL